MKQAGSSIPWDPDSTVFPTRKEIPQLPGAPTEAAWVWGEGDYVYFQQISPFTRLTKTVAWPTESPHTKSRSRRSQGDSERRNCVCQVNLSNSACILDPAYPRTSLPLNVPSTPAFGREAFQHEIKTLAENIA